MKNNIEEVDNNNDKSNPNIKLENNINEVPEPEISEEEMKNIINYINSLDYEKYEKDMEVREALLLLKNKMKKEEEEKRQELNNLKMKENQNDEKILNNDNSKLVTDNYEEETIEKDNNLKYNENDNLNIFKDKLSEKEKEILEKNWVKSTKPEFGEKIVNEKGDKEIIINNNKEKSKKVIKIFNFNLQAKKEQNVKKIENIIYHKPVVIPSMGKFDIYIYI